MNTLLERIDFWAKSDPRHPALEGYHQSGYPVVIRYGELKKKYRSIAQLWHTFSTKTQTVALLCDNTPDTTLLDLALMADGLATVPIPPFFTADQSLYLLEKAAVDTIITDQPQRVQALLQQAAIKVVEEQRVEGSCGTLLAYRLLRRTGEAKRCSFDKITFTSGSTGNPKGVCLNNRALLQVACSLQQATGAHQQDRHLALLPYATLLENIGGIMVPLLAGATIIQPTLARVGLSGSSGLDPACMAHALRDYRASSCIMVPQMLLALVAQVAASPDSRPQHVRFAAVGGAPVSSALLGQAEALGLAVFEGYGLSEAASVVAVNTPEQRKLGTVGRPLDHVSLRTDKSGELWVKGALMEGYLDHDGSVVSSRDEEGFWPTGDIGQLDNDGFLQIKGRKKQIFITAFGRNVAPEWVEKELTIEAAIAQAAVFGEGEAFNVAVVVARDPAGVEEAVKRANSRLPDYAQVQQVVLADAPFSVANDQAVANGTPQRARIQQDYHHAIRSIYNHKEIL